MTYAEIHRRKYERYPQRMRTRALTRKWVYHGKINRPEICSRCGISGKIEAHHIDYASPQLIIWLCSNCHRREHKIKKGYKMDSPVSCPMCGNRNSEKLSLDGFQDDGFGKRYPLVTCQKCGDTFTVSTKDYCELGGMKELENSYISFINRLTESLGNL